MGEPGTVFVANGRAYHAPRDPVLAICADGWDPAYVDDVLARGVMPRLAAVLADAGTLIVGSAQVPTFTNPNNIAIVTGVSAARNGIAGNQFRASDGTQVQVTDPSFLTAETIHAAAQAAGIPSLCVTAKDKLRRLLASGGVPAFSAETAHEQALDDGTALVDLVGPNPGIYDWELSVYTLDLALTLAGRLGSRLVYASLTDYVQHSVGPGEQLADTFFAAVDERIGRALDAGWVVGLAADHGMNAKSDADGNANVRYLSDTLEAAGIASAEVVLPITDPYVTHHASLGSLAWVHVDDPADRGRAAAALAALVGVEGVLTREAAAAAFELPGDRIGDLVVLADASTVLGRREAEHDLSALEGRLRSHGGLHERRVPLVVSRPLAGRVEGGGEARNRDLHDLLLNQIER